MFGSQKTKVCLKGANHVCGVPNVWQSLDYTACNVLVRSKGVLLNMSLFLKKWERTHRLTDGHNEWPLKLGKTLVINIT